MAAALAQGALRCGQWPTLSTMLQHRVRQCLVQVLADRHRGDDVVAALDDERRCPQPGQVGAIVRQEGHASELLGDVGIGPTEAVGQFDGELGLVAARP